MKPLTRLAAVYINGVTLILPTPAVAQWTVYDPANHIQNVYQAARALQEINNQIRQLTHEIEMLENMARDLTALPDSIADDVLDRLGSIDDLMRTAEGIGFGVDDIRRKYEELYPEGYGDILPSHHVLVEEARKRWRQSRSAYRESLLVTAEVVSSARADSENLNHLIGNSQSAVGNLQVLQAGNQLEALQTQQLMQIEAMIGSHYRAEAFDRARHLSEAERGRARTRAFLGTTD